jgi:hypothetical protein
VARFSNIGKVNVDVLPGVQIYATTQTTPTNIYKEHQWHRQMLLELLL